MSKTVIVEAALDLLDEHGLDGVRLRALATRLGVQAPAIYWHFRDKQDLLDEMATEIWRRVAAEVRAMPAGQSWEEDVRGFARIERRALLAYRDGAKAFSGTYLTDADVLQGQEESLERWTASGFDLPATIRAFEVAHSFTVGFCIEEQAVAQARDGRYDLERRAQRVDAETAPLVLASGPEIFGDPEARFEAALDVIVAGIASLRTPTRTRTPTPTPPRRE